MRKRRKRKKKIDEERVIITILFIVLAIWITLVMVKSITNYRMTKKVYDQKYSVYSSLLKEYEMRKKELEVMEKEYEKHGGEKLRGDNISQTEERASDTGEENSR